MIPVKNTPALLNLAYIGYNRGIDGDFAPVRDSKGFIVRTYCNEFVQFVANAMGYAEFNNLMANQMVTLMADPQNGWIAVGDSVGQHHANTGVLVVAGWQNNSGHGHVSLIVPGIIEKSSSAGHPVPKCVNVGREVFFGKRLSFAFSYPAEKPTIYALAGMI